MVLLFLVLEKVIGNINSATGEITCVAGATTQGTYELAIKIEDALGIDQGSA